jgi:GNAT superfamily N-acetyltransferase
MRTQRGKGLGGALLAKAETIARELPGHQTISLIAEDTHQDALRLYQFQGIPRDRPPPRGQGRLAGRCVGMDPVREVGLTPVSARGSG